MSVSFRVKRVPELDSETPGQKRLLGLSVLDEKRLGPAACHAGALCAAARSASAERTESS
jgi:hypothetical protein